MSHKLPLPSSSQDAPAVATTQSTGMPPETALLTSQVLLRGNSAVLIEHNGALYRLQTTRQGKLILTK